MKINNWLLLLLAVAVVFLSVRIAFDHNDNTASDTKENTEMKEDTDNGVLANIMTRTSVRAYSDKSISDSTVTALLKAGMAAPSAMNKQPWHFTVITDKAMLKNIADEFKNAHMAEKAPLAIVVSGNMDLTIEGEGHEYWAQDCSAASENILLAAHGMGLGAVWCGIYPISERVNGLKKLLAMPANLTPLNIIVIGYPAGPNTPKDKWDTAKINYIR